MRNSSSVPKVGGCSAGPRSTGGGSERRVVEARIGLARRERRCGVDVDRPNLCVRHREHRDLRHLFQRAQPAPLVRDRHRSVVGRDRLAEEVAHRECGQAVAAADERDLRVGVGVERTQVGAVGAHVLDDDRLGRGGPHGARRRRGIELDGRQSRGPVAVALGDHRQALVEADQPAVLGDQQRVLDAVQQDRRRQARHAQRAVVRQPRRRSGCSQYTRRWCGSTSATTFQISGAPPCRTCTCVPRRKPVMLGTTENAPSGLVADTGTCARIALLQCEPQGVAPRAFARRADAPGVTRRGS